MQIERIEEDELRPFARIVLNAREAQALCVELDAVVTNLPILMAMIRADLRMLLSKGA